MPAGDRTAATPRASTTAVQIIAHRVARRRVFLVCAGIWATTALVVALMSVWEGAIAAGVTPAVTACLIGLIMAGCALVWRHHPIPSPDRLYPMSLPHTPTVGWLGFATVSATWSVGCVLAGAAALPLGLAVMTFAIGHALIGSVVLVPGVVMGSRRRYLQRILARSPLAQQELDALAADWTNPDGGRPFGRV